MLQLQSELLLQLAFFLTLRQGLDIFQDFHFQLV